MSMVSTDGTQCNMVGTSYYAFKYAQVVRTCTFPWRSIRLAPMAAFNMPSLLIVTRLTACVGGHSTTVVTTAVPM